MKPLNEIAAAGLKETGKTVSKRFSVLAGNVTFKGKAIFRKDTKSKLLEIDGWILWRKNEKGTMSPIFEKKNWRLVIPAILDEKIKNLKSACKKAIKPSSPEFRKIVEEAPEFYKKAYKTVTMKELFSSKYITDCIKEQLVPCMESVSDFFKAYMNETA